MMMMMMMMNINKYIDVYCKMNDIKQHTSKYLLTVAFGKTLLNIANTKQQRAPTATGKTQD
jgi:hypothetical protein